MAEENVDLRNIGISVLASSAVSAIMMWMMTNYFVKRSVIKLLEEYEVEPPPPEGGVGTKFKSLLMEMAEEALERALQKLKETGG